MLSVTCKPFVPNINMLTVVLMRVVVLGVVVLSVVAPFIRVRYIKGGPSPYSRKRVA